MYNQPESFWQTFPLTRSFTRLVKYCPEEILVRVICNSVVDEVCYVLGLPAEELANTFDP
jgi:hypothetical protein